MTLVADADVDEGRATDAMRVEVDVEFDGEQRVLAPVAKHLLRDFIGSGFQGRLAGVVVSGVEFREVDTGEAQQGERAALARAERTFVVAQQPGHGEAPGHHAVFVEVQEAGEAALEDVPDALEKTGNRLRARPSVGKILRTRRTCPLGARAPHRVISASGVPRLGRLPRRHGTARPFVALYLPMHFVVVTSRYRDPPGGQHPASVHFFHRSDIPIFQLEGGGNGSCAGHLLPVPGVTAARVVAKGHEGLRMAGRQRVQPVERLQQRGLAALVLAHQAGDTVADIDVARVPDVLVLPDSNRLEYHD